MSTKDYLALFQQQQRGRNRPTLSPELINRWERSVRWRGLEEVKVQLAGARRTLTLMEKAKKQFCNLRAEHELAINAAAGALRALVTELELVAKWATEYHAFFCRARSIEEEADLEAVAQARWGSDEHALQFETDLMDELASKDGKLGFAQWMHSAGKYAQANLEDIEPAIRGLASPRRGHAYEPRVETLRSRAAWTIRKAREERLRPHVWSSFRGAECVECVVCSVADYEGYLKYRQQVAATAAHVVASASVGAAS